MRKRKQSSGITVNAIAGTYVVFLGLNLQKTFHNNFRGFAIKRKDHTDGEITWARGLKTFQSVEPDAVEVRTSVRQAPILMMRTCSPSKVTNELQIFILANTCDYIRTMPSVKV